VHHVDGNGRNNTPSNLVICQDRSYHKLLHTRARILTRGGRPETDWICARCDRVLPVAMFYRYRHEARYRSACRPCEQVRLREWYAGKCAEREVSRRVAVDS
jgi:recombinational DNA repair protein (RecF pathway)